MNLAAEKISIAQKVLSTDNTGLIKNLMAVLENYQTDLWEELSEEQRMSVARARAQLSKGEGVSHKEAMKKYRKWRTK